MIKQSQQVLTKLEIKKLKHINDLTIEFSDSKKLIALIGINGCGKSSILHVMSCLYHPPIFEGLSVVTSFRRTWTEDPIFRFSKYLKSSQDENWRDTEIVSTYSYRVGNEFHENKTTVYSKTDRWSPKYSRRPQRVTRYLGIDSCVPDVELELKDAIPNYKAHSLNEELHKKIIGALSYIMNRSYSGLEMLDAGKKKYKRVQWGASKYDSLNMSAGEQRIMKILEEVYSAPKYALILIDEIDLLIHLFSLKRLLNKLNEIADEKNLQIIFTTHSLEVLQLKNIIDIKYIHNDSGKTLCLDCSDINLIERMSGEKVTQFEFFVEDNFSEQIIKKICRELKVCSRIDIFKFGAASNCFSVAAGLVMSNKMTDNTVLVIDGDVIRTEQEKISMIKKMITGDTQIADSQRSKVLSQITQYNLPEGESPEKFVYRILCDIDSDDEFITACKELPILEDPHEIVKSLAERFNYTDKEVMKEMIDIVSKHELWEDFTKPIRNIIINKLGT